MTKSVRAAWAALALITVLPLVVSMTGCGGGGRSSAPTRAKNGSVTFSVIWPKPTRLIPLAAKSIVVTVSRGAFTKSATLTKPENFDDATPPSVVTLDTLEVGTVEEPFSYTVSATAFPSADGTGVAQATATTAVPLTTVAPSSNIELTMDSTIKTLEVFVLDAQGNAIDPFWAGNMRRGGVRTFEATAKDAQGRIVLTTPGKISWAANPAGIGTFTTPTGNPITFTATAPGTTGVIATETESGVASAVATVNVVATGLASSSWAKFHADVQNGGRSSVGAPAITSSPQFAAGFNATTADAVVLSSPVIDADGTVYVGSYDDNIYAFDSTGAVKWTHKTQGDIEATPLITAEGLIIVGSMDGTLYALKPSGMLAWKVATAGPILSGATIDKEGYLYVTTLAPSADKPGAIHCIDSLDGQVKWTVGMPSGSAMTPALGTGIVDGRESIVYAGNIAGTLFGLNTATGAVRWQYNTEGPLYSSAPVVVAGKVLLATQEGKLHAVDALTGAAAWETPFDTEAQVFATPAISADGARAYVATFDNVSGLDQSRVFSVSVATGTEVWRSADDLFSAGGFTSSPALSGDGTVLYLGNYDGKVYGIETATGGIVWSIGPGAGEYFDSSPAIGANGTIYIGGFTGKVYAITQ